MKEIQRNEILPLDEYERIRPHFRKRIIALKEIRRLLLGSHMSIAWENHDTLLYQIQEMLRIERIQNEAGIQHEIETYNQLISKPGQLSATLFIEYEDKAERSWMLQRLSDLKDHMHIHLGDEKFPAAFMKHDGEEPGKIPAVNYLRFDLGQQAQALLKSSEKAALVVTHPDYSAIAPINDNQREILIEDVS